MAEKMQPLAIVAAQVGAEGWDQVQRGVNVPANRQELIEEALTLVRAGASVIHVHPVAEDPEETGSYYEYTLEAFDAVCRALRKVYPNIMFCWDFYGATDEKALYQAALSDPLFGSRSAFIGEAHGEGWDIPETPIEQVIEQLRVALDHKVRRFPTINSWSNLERLKTVFQKISLPDPKVVWFYFTGGKAIEPTRENYYAAKRNLPRDVVSAVVFCVGDNWKELADSAIENGDHVRVGLHESEAEERNIAFVQYCVKKAATIGRPIATPEEARVILGYLK